jgi:hypothetical protein
VKTKKSKKTKKHFSAFSPQAFSKLQPIIFVAGFAAIGVVYLLATHAANTLNLSFPTQDTAGHLMSGVYVQVTGSPPPTGCSPVNGTTSQSANGGPPTAYFYCSNSYGRVTSISYAGYHLCGCSPVQIGTQYGGNYPANGSGGTIIMESDTPAPPTPTPAPTPTPTPTPSPPKSSGGSSGSSGGSSTKKTSTTPLTVGQAATPAVTDSSTENPQTTSDNTDQLLSDNSTSTDPNVPSDRSATVTSSDRLTSVTFPKGTFNTDAYCSIDAGDSGDVPVKGAKTIGPYSIDCTDVDGNALNDLKQSLDITMALPSDKTNYTAYANTTNWTKVPSTNSSKTLRFKLTKAELFAATPGKASNWGTVIVNVAGAIVLIAIVGGGLYLYHRRQNPYE